MTPVTNRIKKPKQPGYVLAIKIFDALLCAAVITLIILYYASTEVEGFKFLSSKLVSGLVLIILGPVVLSMPILSNQSLQGENKGDNLMMILGFLLIVIGIFTLLL